VRRGRRKGEEEGGGGRRGREDVGFLLVGREFGSVARTTTNVLKEE
jgi:hypothetical protein